VTASDGTYQLSSEKKAGHVFISVPSSYTVARNGVLPQFWNKLQYEASVAERSDFQLLRDPGQDNHTILFLGDTQFLKGEADLKQFKTVADDVNGYIRNHPSEKIYGVTLGDMTWDYYWYERSFGLNEYLGQINQIEGICIFHCIGNHDTDMNAVGNWAAKEPYREILGPTSYSFNIGQVHYIVLDDFISTNGGTKESRGCELGLSEETALWLQNDLSYVDKETPVVVVGHMPLYTKTGSESSDATRIIRAYLAGYNVRFISAHTHYMYNVKKESDFNERNSGTICTDFWSSGHQSWSDGYGRGLLVSVDGSPGGYRITKFKGTSHSTRYKAVGYPESYQFRVYDRNSIDLDSSKWIPNAGTNHKAAFEEYTSAYKANSGNYIYVNIWDWASDWTLQITEEGRELEVEEYSGYDPLYLATGAVARCNKEDSGEFTLSPAPQKGTGHLFRAKASSATSTVVVTATDPYGNTYTQTVARPKAFTYDQYLSE
ncbi:MAG: calcineurin-like phosphoesterase C-terminal domain-containing protein, partial [Candidatus Cryptobacteroides sp.]